MGKGRKWGGGLAGGRGRTTQDTRSSRREMEDGGRAKNNAQTRAGAWARCQTKSVVVMMDDGQTQTPGQPRRGLARHGSRRARGMEL